MAEVVISVPLPVIVIVPVVVRFTCSVSVVVFDPKIPPKNFKPAEIAPTYPPEGIFKIASVILLPSLTFLDLAKLSTLCLALFPAKEATELVSPLGLSAVFIIVPSVVKDDFPLKSYVVT